MKLRSTVDISTRSFLDDAELQIQIKSLVHRILSGFADRRVKSAFQGMHKPRDNKQFNICIKVYIFDPKGDILSIYC